jgi:hypothetical protein
VKKGGIDLAMVLSCLAIAFASVLPLCRFFGISINLSWQKATVSSGPVGEYNVEPKFILRTKALGQLESQTFVEGSERRGDKFEWRMWGDPDDVSPDFTIGVHSTAAHGYYRVGIATRLKQFARFKEIETKVGSTPVAFQSSIGEFEALAFSVLRNDGEKYCLAFQSKNTLKSHYITGWHCAAENAVPAIDQLKCLVDHVQLSTSAESETSGADCPALVEQRQAETVSH